jgi:glutathione synthase/RimK-type ligase-like ATP-grasp enzyme
VILVVTNPREDGHVRPVIDELSRRGHEYRIYDPSSYPYSSAITVETLNGRVRTVLNCEAFELDLGRVNSVWYRRPGDVGLSPELSTEETAWLRTECSHLLRASWEGTPALWVSEPDAIRRASLKITQLRIAMGLGFAVPRFIVTNDVTRAAEFLRSCQNGTVVKVLANPLIVLPDRAATFYTHLISRADEQIIDSVRYGPTFLQEFAAKAMDVRVTVFGDQLFAVGIDSTHLAEARVDFRRVEAYDLPHAVINLPDEVHRRCLELVRSLGLRFGAIDLLLTPDGGYVFLEINPNGQWYWLEWVTGAPMVKSLCDLLATGCTH